MKQTLPDRVRLGAFEVDLRAGELRQGEHSVYLQEQSLAVLRVLVEHGRGMVTRNEIKQKLWPNDTVVDFDQGIKTTIHKLRQAFGDSADEPRYIETVARRGYRLLVAVECLEDSAPTSTVDANQILRENAIAAGGGDGAAVQQQPNWGLIGQKVSHYRVLEVIGGGGMGMVYKAEDLKLGREVALKFLPPELAADPVSLQRFEREARAASLLDHPNICTIHEVEEHDGEPFIVMQLLQGETLRDRLSALASMKTKMPVGELLKIALQTCEGLHAAHSKGIIHRDIKPANIFLTSSGQVKILDFGLAKLVETGDIERDADRHPEAACLGPADSFVSGHGFSRAAAEPPPEMSGLQPATPDPTLTRLGIAMGTAGYMSPEQVRGEKLDARTDIFSFGLVLYEMATGQRAFTGETAAVVHDAILKQPPTPIHNLNSSVTPKLEQIVGKALEKDRERRYQSVAEVDSDLRSLAADRPVPVAEVSARRYERHAGLMATSSGTPWWTWLVAASFIACFLVGFIYLPLKLPEELGINYGTRGNRVTVSVVTPGSPGDKAGLKRGDRVVNVGGRPAQTGIEFISTLGNTRFDHPVSIAVLRESRKVYLQLTLDRERTRDWTAKEDPGRYVNFAVSLTQLLVGLLVLFKRPRDLTANAAGIVLCILGTLNSNFLSPSSGLVWRSLPLIIQWFVFPALTISGLPIVALLWLSLSFSKPLLHRRWASMMLAVVAVPPVVYATSFNYIVLFAPKGAVAALLNAFVTYLGRLGLISLITILVAIAVCLAILAANYFRLREVNDRRRIRLVVFGLLLFLANPLAIVLFALFQKTVWIATILNSRLVFELAQVPFTICVAYAVLKQRLFQIRFIVRQSLQYAIARGALLIPLPILAGILIFDLIAHKGQPFGALLSTHGWAYALMIVAGVVAHAKRSQWMEVLDRRFYRARYDAQHLLRQTVDEIRASSNLADVAIRVVVRLEQALHPEFVAILTRESAEPSFRSIASAPPGIQPNGLSAGSKLMAALRLFAKPLQTSPAESGWLWRQLPREDTTFLQDARIDLMVPIAIALHGPEALMVLGPKKSEEPYGSEDQELLSGIGSALDLLLQRPGQHTITPGAPGSLAAFLGR